MLPELHQDLRADHVSVPAAHGKKKIAWSRQLALSHSSDLGVPESGVHRHRHQPDLVLMQFDGRPVMQRLRMPWSTPGYLLPSCLAQNGLVSWVASVESPCGAGVSELVLSRKS
mmetsp:Transcript_85483/g.275731  ORF Transcript_85483/g.275731 Transcript_85483/m.275731 type:complete len:114 (-) Transcript_85483:1066-1407(-)